MAQHNQLTELTGVKIYIANLLAPGQRGTNENTNGLILPYLLKVENEIESWIMR